MVHKEDIVRGLGELGLRPGDVVLVHSSLSSFGYVEGGADAVIDALLDAVGPEGTVMVPTLTGSPEDSPRVVDAKMMRQIMKPILERDPYFWVRRAR